MEAAAGRKQDAEKLNKNSGVPSGAPVFCNYVSFFFRGSRGFDVGKIFLPFLKWVASYLSKKSNNPNVSPIGNRFGLYWFGAGNRT